MFDVTVAQKDLRQALALVGKVADTKSPTPALACVRAEVRDGNLRLEAFDNITKIGVSIPLAEKSNGSNSTMLLPNVFISFSEVMPSGLVNVYSDSDRGPVAVMRGVAHVRKFTSPTIPEYDWPSGVADTETKSFSVSVPVRKLLLLLKPLHTYSDDRYGAKVAFNLGNVTRMAMDGSRIFYGTEPIDVRDGGTFIFGKASLKLFSKMLENADPEDDVEMTVFTKANGTLMFVGATKDHWIRFALLAQFPEIANNIPKKWPIRVTCDRLELLDKIRAATTALEPKEARETRVVFCPDGMMKLGTRCPADVSRKNNDPENFQFVDQIQTEMHGFVWSDKTASKAKAAPQYVQIAIDPDFFRDAVEFISTEKVRILADLVNPDELGVLFVPEDHDFAKTPTESPSIQYVMLRRL